MTYVYFVRCTVIYSVFEICQVLYNTDDAQDIAFYFKYNVKINKK